MAARPEVIERKTRRNNLRHGAENVEELREDEAPEPIDDALSALFDDDDSSPGDRRRDPLRKP